jgi:hypothetical protein
MKEQKAVAPSAMQRSENTRYITRLATAMWSESMNMPTWMLKMELMMESKFASCIFTLAPKLKFCGSANIVAPC